jgi:hypothetical protein
MDSRLITVNEVIHNGACVDGVMEFYKENFDGRTAVSISEVLEAGADASYLKLDGDGNGYGYGNGNGYGNGYGYGYGNGDDFKIITYKGKPVYYIDEIPCVFNSIKGDCAKVDVIDVITFQATEQYIGKFNGVFAHGETIKKAREDAERKYYASLDAEQSLELFKEKFKSNVKYPNSEFYNWHSILTGSCDSGKDMWMKQRGIEMSGEMTVAEFIELTKGSYGGDMIMKLVEDSVYQ